MKAKKYAAAVVSTSGRAGSKRRVVSQRMLPRARARKEVCDQRGGGGVREQRRHCHGVGWEEGALVSSVVLFYRHRPALVGATVGVFYDLGGTLLQYRYRL